MAKQADVEFRIRSRNINPKSITEVTKELDSLIDAQERQRKSAADSSKTIESLQADYRKLANSLDAVKAAQGATANLARDEQRFRELSVEIRETIAALDRLRAGQAKLRQSGQVVPPELARSIKQLEATYSELIAKARGLATSVSTQRKSLSELGVDARNSAAAMRTLAEVEGTIIVAQARTTQAINASSVALQKQEQAAKEAATAEDRRQKELAESIRFEQQRAAAARKAREADIRSAFDEADASAASQAAARLAREKEITAEVQRRIAAEKAAAEARFADLRRLGAEQARIAAKRQDAVAAFSAAPATQFRTGPEKQADLAREQIRARDAALRMLEVQQRADAVEARLAATRARLGQATGKLASDTNRARAAQNIFNEDTRKSLGFMQRARGQVLSLASAYFGLFGAINVIAGAMEAVTSQEGIEAKLRVANNGDAAKAAEDFKFLREQADQLGLVVVDMAKKFGDYKIAANAMGVSNDLVAQSFTDINKIIKVNRLSQDDADGVLRAMVQIMSKGRVQAEELRGQLGDRLPGAVAIFAKANNIALSDLDKKLQKGQVGVDFLLRGLRAYAKSVESELPAATQTAQAAMARLQNAYREFLIELGKAGVVDALKEMFTSLTEFLKSDDGKKAAQDLAGAFKVLAEVIKVAIANLDNLILGAKVLLALQVFKWVVSVGGAFKAAAMQMVAFRTAAMGAAAGTGAMATASRGLLALLGPVGVALLAAAGAFYAFDRAARQATERTEHFIGRMGALRRAEGESIRGAIKAAESEREAKFKELADLEKRLEKANKNSAAAKGSARLRALTIGETGIDKVLGEDPTTLNEKIKETRVQIDGLGVGISNAAKRYREFKLAQAAATDIPIPEMPVPGGGDEKDAEKAQRLAEQLAEQRLAIAHRTADALLDVEGDISQARIEKEAITQAQIDANLSNTLDVIAKDIEKKRADIEKLRTEAVKLGAPGAAADASKALEQLDVLKQVREERAREQATIQSMQLLEKQLNDLIAVRDAKLEAIATRQELHQITQYQAQQEAYDVQLASQDGIMAKVVALRDFILANRGALSQMMNVDEVLIKLDTLQNKTQQIDTEADRLVQKWKEDIAGGMADTFGVLAEGIADVVRNTGSLSDAFKAAGDAFMAFAADFLIEIGKMIIKTAILKALEGMAGQGGWVGSLAKMAVGTQHTGGMVGSPRHSYREVSPLVFANAPRYHSGGFPGMRSDEVPVIAQRGEEILSRDNPRNARNGGAGGGAPNIKIINAIDSASVVNEAMNSRDGQTPVINMMKARRQEIKNILGIKE